MQGCSLETAFPAGDNGRDKMAPVTAAATVGCTDDSATQYQRRRERRKTQRCKTAAEASMPQFTDPDRPAFRRVEGPPPMNNPMDIDEEEQGAPKFITDDSLGSRIASKFSKKQGADMPVDGTPGWFGSSSVDEEPFMPYTGAEATEEKDSGEYMLRPNFMNTFEGGGLEKSAGTMLPTPSINDSWKTITPVGGRSAFFEHLPAPGGMIESLPTDVKRQMDKILARLDDLENMKYGSEYAQSEIFMIIASGLFLMFCMDVIAKKR